MHEHFTSHRALSRGEERREGLTEGWTVEEIDEKREEKEEYGMVEGGKEWA